MKVVLYSCVVVAFVLAGTPVHALEPFVLYDAFSTATINPVKWSGYEFGFHGTEATRRIDTALGELRMSHRAFGDPSSNNGRIFSGLGLTLIKNTALITALQAQVTPLTAQAVQCSGNTLPSVARPGGLHGAFFNTNTPTPGSAMNDVQAQLFLRRLSNSTDPSNVLHVVAQVYRCTNQSCSTSDSFKESDLGTVTLGQQVRLQLEWDKPNHRFLFQQATNPKVAISYAPLSDATAPSSGFKVLEVVEGVDNCTTTPRPLGFVDAAFDNVRVNQSATP